MWKKDKSHHAATAAVDELGKLGSDQTHEPPTSDFSSPDFHLSHSIHRLGHKDINKEAPPAPLLVHEDDSSPDSSSATATPSSNNISSGNSLRQISSTHSTGNSRTHSLFGHHHHSHSHSHHALSPFSRTMSGSARTPSFGKTKADHKADYPEILQSFDPAEIDLLQKTFNDLAKRSPATTMDKETFLKYFHLPGLLGEQLFVAFDTKKTGKIEIEDFLRGMAVVLRGSSDAKARMVFQMFDMDAKEGITRKELKTMLLTCLSSSYTLLEPTASEAGENAGAAPGSATTPAASSATHGAESNFGIPLRSPHAAEHGGTASTMHSDASSLHTSTRPMASPRRQRPTANIATEVPVAAASDAALKETESTQAVSHEEFLSFSNLNLGKAATHNHDRGFEDDDEYMYVEFNLMEQNVNNMVEDAFRDHGPDGKLSLDEFVEWINRHPRILEIVFTAPGVSQHGKQLESRRLKRKNADMAGWLIGPTKEFFKRYAQRYYVLQGVYLYKYHDKHDSIPKESIFMPGAVIREIDASNKPSEDGSPIPGAQALASDGASGSKAASSKGDAVHTGEPIKKPSIRLASFIEASRNHSMEKKPNAFRELTKSFGVSASVREFGIEISWDNGYSRCLYAPDAAKQQEWVKKLREAAKNRDINEDYRLEPTEFATGAFSTIHKAIKTKTKEVCAVKVVPKTGLDPVERQGMLSELSILENTSHPNIIALEAIFEDKEFWYIVMELCSGGDLLEFMQAYGAVHESVARKIIVQILHGLGYLHSLGIIHRDMKPKNILFGSQPRLKNGSPCTPEALKAGTSGFDAEVKIIDFGYSKYVRPHDRLNEGVGTFKYWAPEMAKGLSAYSMPVDVWGVGILLYRLVTGRFPFVESGSEDLLEVIARKPYVQDTPEFVALSQECKDLIAKMLAKDPNERIGVEAAKLHPWIRPKENPASPPAPATANGPSTT
eukprot:CAMPEP_0184699598 /NCGR_PEP_ID=MMETSP0313-20130426/5815_1 /TAXON_ID=2792 /ORGANISM="Porphyridium aerugineum, Strain SAG 1380-2" /LENGTH=952 /DNA_ID=CAMNT_0027158717 /DNA_START=653 /DNA_END=3511 /DNA_ORIENTATION=-